MRILIVDDEPYILEGIYALLTNEDEWELYKASSANQALNILSKNRMDIVLSDIQMRGMNGISLLKEIGELWPFCKVILLTAYDNFTYAQNAISNGAYGYILKTDGDEAIISEIRRCCEAINQEMKLAARYNDYRKQATNSFPLLQNAALTNVIEWMDNKQAAKELTEYQIEIDIDMPMLLIGVGFDYFPEQKNPQEKFEILLCVRDIFEKYLQPKFKCWHASKENKNMFWILQTDDTPEKSLVYCRQSLEIIQENVFQALDTSISIIYDEFIRFEQLHDHYNMLDTLLSQIMMKGEEGVLVDYRFYKNRKKRNEAVGVKTNVLDWENFNHALSRNDIDAFIKALDRILYSKDMESVAMRLQVYHQICATMIKYTQEQGLEEEFLSNPEFFEAFCSYSGRRIFREKLLKWVSFLMKEGKRKKLGRKEELINLINQYIQVNLSGDLSLQTIADNFYMNPTYLSRFYKIQTGNTIGEKITQERLQLAKKMLVQRDIKVSQIAIDVGYESAAYFSRVFHKRENITPQEWREKNT